MARVGLPGRVLSGHRRCSRRQPCGLHDWGFDLADARRVTIWQGGQDENVTSAESVWLSEHLPGTELRLLPDEGHISIGLRFPEILDDLVARAGPKATSTSEPGPP
jgi:hypothetical protein